MTVIFLPSTWFGPLVSFVLPDTDFLFLCRLFYFALDPECFLLSFWVPPLLWSASERSPLTALVSPVTSPRSPPLQSFAQAEPHFGEIVLPLAPCLWRPHLGLTFFSQLFKIHFPVIWLCSVFNSPLCHLSQGSRHFHSAKWCPFAGENLAEQVSDPDHFLHPMED